MLKFWYLLVDIFENTAKKNKKIKQADQILPETYGTTLIQLWRNYVLTYLIKLYCNMFKNIAQMIDLKWNSGLKYLFTLNIHIKLL